VLLLVQAQAQPVLAQAQAQPVLAQALVRGPELGLVLQPVLELAQALVRVQQPVPGLARRPVLA